MGYVRILQAFELRQERSRSEGVMTVSLELREPLTLLPYVFCTDRNVRFCLLQMPLQHLPVDRMTRATNWIFNCIFLLFLQPMASIGDNLARPSKQLHVIVQQFIRSSRGFFRVSASPLQLSGVDAVSDWFWRHRRSPQKKAATAECPYKQASKLIHIKNHGYDSLQHPVTQGGRPRASSPNAGCIRLAIARPPSVGQSSRRQTIRARQQTASLRRGRNRNCHLCSRNKVSHGREAGLPNSIRQN